MLNDNLEYYQWNDFVIQCNSPTSPWMEESGDNLMKLSTMHRLVDIGECEHGLHKTKLFKSSITTVGMMILKLIGNNLSVN